MRIMSILKLQHTYFNKRLTYIYTELKNTCTYLICASFYLILMDYITPHHRSILTVAKHSSKQKTFYVF